MAAVQSRVIDYIGRPAESGLLSIILVAVAVLLLAPTIRDGWRLVLTRFPGARFSRVRNAKTKAERIPPAVPIQEHIRIDGPPDVD